MIKNEVKDDTKTRIKNEYSGFSAEIGEILVWLSQKLTWVIGAFPVDKLQSLINNAVTSLEKIEKRDNGKLKYERLRSTPVILNFAKYSIFY